jgi:dolichyl-phosphate beta-glucosyltransferase
MTRPTLSIIIPAYNEARRLPDSLRKIAAYLAAHPLPVEIIVVDDGSRDGTEAAAAAAAPDLPLRVIRRPANAGKGAAVRAGMLVATGDFVLFSDADLSTPIEEVELLLAAIRAGAPIAIASRGLQASQVEVHQPWVRERMGKTFNLLVRLLVLGGIADTQCGFKLFRREVVAPLFEPLHTAGYGFDVEVLTRARGQGYQIAEVATRWINSPDSRLRPGVDSARMFLELLRIRWLLGRDAKKAVGPLPPHQPPLTNR